MEVTSSTATTQSKTKGKKSSATKGKSKAKAGDVNPSGATATGNTIAANDTDEKTSVSDVLISGGEKPPDSGEKPPDVLISGGEKPNSADIAEQPSTVGEKP